MIEIEGKSVDFISQEWDICVILDACRYDIFSDLYNDILIGDKKLKKAKTHCKGTFEWFTNNFDGQDCSDIIYIDPIIMFDEIMPNKSFYKIVRVWKTHWDYTHGTILPSSMTKVAVSEIMENPDKRFIIHYHQPHPPYLQDKFIGIDGAVDKPEEILKNIGKKRKFNFYQFFQGRLRKTIGCKNAWYIMSKFGMTPLDYYGKIYVKYGMDELYNGYKETLRMSLESLNDVIRNKNGKVVITADHSKNFDGSNKNLKNQSVPWLEIT